MWDVVFGWGIAIVRVGKNGLKAQKHLSQGKRSDTLGMRVPYIVTP